MNIYTSIEEAKSLIWERWANQKLKQEVTAYLRDLPEPVLDQPRAWLDRYIATPDNEVFRFAKLAEEIQLVPIVIESLKDKFYRKNSDKMCLAKMAFYDDTGANTENIAIIDDRRSHMLELSAIKTKCGHSFSEFHHSIYRRYFDIEVYDVSPWVLSKAAKARDNYRYLLSLFIGHAVLFEDFICCELDENESRFTNEVVIPAFEATEKRFGCRPIICRIFNDDELAEQKNWGYPDFIQQDRLLLCHE